MANPRTIQRLQARIHERAVHALEFEINDPRAGMVTVTKVELSGDLSLAKVYYSVLGGRAERSRTDHMLESAGGFLQRKIAGHLQLRRAPKVVWIFDEAEAKAAQIDSLIAKAIERDQTIQEQGTAPEIVPEAWEDEYESMLEREQPPKKPPAD